MSLHSVLSIILEYACLTDFFSVLENPQPFLYKEVSAASHSAAHEIVVLWEGTFALMLLDWCEAWFWKYYLFLQLFVQMTALSLE